MRIVWTEPAIQDAENIKAYIEHDSEIYAIRVLEEIFEVVDELSIFPRLGRAVPEFEKHDI
ncbi:MAG: type II toxin-antitoxin system RelE/ParE family toxin [Syntrophomonadaceae bacterium]|nr:type II toxin-antitoxin system RelE/ParE family toxin [Syntrophomonadaceae bacterium]MDD4549610.1 type II toxin-antitoxin system RelE/ParE family toxin [Syntrophomonadaceae bacterium]